jgi:hypothetical protein
VASDRRWRNRPPEGSLPPTAAQDEVRQPADLAPTKAGFETAVAGADGISLVTSSISRMFDLHQTLQALHALLGKRVDVTARGAGGSPPMVLEVSGRLGGRRGGGLVRAERGQLPWGSLDGGSTGMCSNCSWARWPCWWPRRTRGGRRIAEQQAHEREIQPVTSEIASTTGGHYGILTNTVAAIARRASSSLPPSPGCLARPRPG